MHSVFTLYIYHISALLVAIQDAVAARPVAFCHHERRCFHDTLNYDVIFAEWGSRQSHRCRQLKFSQNFIGAQKCEILRNYAKFRKVTDDGRVGHFAK